MKPTVDHHTHAGYEDVVGSMQISTTKPSRKDVMIPAPTRQHYNARVPFEYDQTHDQYDQTSHPSKGSHTYISFSSTELRRPVLSFYQNKYGGDFQHMGDTQRSRYN